MSVKLRKRKNSDGTTTLLLDIYQDGKRHYEFLKHLKLSKPSNPADRQANKDKLDLAQRIAIKRAQELSASDYAIITDTGKKVIVTEWMQAFIDGYKKKDVRTLQGALNRFKDFLNEEKKQNLTFGRLDELTISDFQDYLRRHSRGEGASSYFSRFKKMVKQAHRQKIILTNPAADVRIVQGLAKKKDTLTLEEIQILAATPIQSEIVKRAFLYSCVTGLRWVDVKALTWKNINLSNRYMYVQQSKTDRTVQVNLNDTAIQLLGEPGKDTEPVFNLPSADGANKTVKAWVKRAGINKHITWHNARHSFGTNLVYYGTDVVTASSLLGHASLKHTQRYVKAANDMKEKATDNLNFKL